MCATLIFWSAVCIFVASKLKCHFIFSSRLIRLSDLIAYMPQAHFYLTGSFFQAHHQEGYLCSSPWKIFWDYYTVTFFTGMTHKQQL